MNTDMRVHTHTVLISITMQLCTERERESTNINCHAVMLRKLLDTLHPPEVLLLKRLLSSQFSHPPKNHEFI
jgi:hypothetical protein